VGTPRNVIKAGQAWQ